MQRVNFIVIVKYNSTGKHFEHILSILNPKKFNLLFL